jgi:hypothetical protein
MKLKPRPGPRRLLDVVQKVATKYQVRPAVDDGRKCARFDLAAKGAFCVAGQSGGFVDGVVTVSPDADAARPAMSRHRALTR